MYSAVFKEVVVFIKLYLLEIVFSAIFDNEILMIVGIFMTAK